MNNIFALQKTKGKKIIQLVQNDDRILRILTISEFNELIINL